MRRNIGVLAIVVALLALVPGLVGSTARAHETTDGTVNGFHCIAADAGLATITPGSEVVFRIAWGTQVLGDQKTFLGAQTTVMSVNDGLMEDVSDQWSAPASSGAGYASAIEVPTGVSLASGEQMQFTFALLLDRAITEQFNPAAGGTGGPINHPAGLVFGGTCTVTGE